MLVYLFSKLIAFFFFIIEFNVFFFFILFKTIKINHYLCNFNINTI